MDNAKKDRTEGKMDNLGGRAKEAMGSLTGDDKQKAEGQADQTKGDMKQSKGDLKESAQKAGDSIKKALN